MARERMLMRTAKRKLAVLWLAGASLPFLVLVAQSLFGHHGNRVNEAWGWLLPTIMPTLSLIVAVYAAEAREREVTPYPVDTFMFQLTLGLSIFYLAVVSLTVLLEPFVGRPSIELMHQSNLYLGPLQGIVSAALGVFFVRRAEYSDTDSSKISTRMGQ